MNIKLQTATKSRTNWVTHEFDYQYQEAWMIIGNIRGQGDEVTHVFRPCRLFSTEVGDW